MGAHINFGIVGCGAISEKHGQAMTQVERARLVAVADVIEARARAFADKYVSAEHANGQDKVYVDYRAMLEDPDVDAVIVASPSGMHAKMGLDVLDAGKHVLIEKPLALTSQDAWLLLDKASNVGKCLGTVHPNRYYPTSQMIYRAIRDGRFGKLSHGVATVRWNRRASYYDEAPWRKTREMDGGILFNQAWHAFDALLWYMGSPVVDVQGMTATRFHDVETEDVAIVSLRLENGALGMVEATTNVYPINLEHTVSIFGDTGTAVQGGARVDALKAWRVMGDDERDVLDRFSEGRLQTLGAGWAHGRVLQGFVDQIDSGVVNTELVDGAIALVELVERVVG
jgi:UDP-N-acetyl-2-amino-2-deoxyglucuronate dehydrogenase